MGLLRQDGYKGKKNFKGRRSWESYLAIKAARANFWRKANWI